MTIDFFKQEGNFDDDKLKLNTYVKTYTMYGTIFLFIEKLILSHELMDDLVCKDIMIIINTSATIGLKKVICKNDCT